MTPRVKICCIQSVEEAWLAIRLGASALGLVSEMPSGPGVIPETRIAEIAGSVPPGIDTFLLTCRQDVRAIIEQQRRTGVSTIQLVDDLPAGAHQALRSALPGIRIVQVVHVVGEESLPQAVAVAPHVHALLLDSGNPSLPVKVLGGTGRIHDWSLSRRIRDTAGRPVYLAGGLDPANVAEAVARVAPFGLDVCNGVRTGGRLDDDKLDRFVRAAASAAPAL